MDEHSDDDSFLIGCGFAAGAFTIAFIALAILFSTGHLALVWQP